MKKTILITRAFFPDSLASLKKDFSLTMWEGDTPPAKRWIIDHLPFAGIEDKRLPFCVNPEVYSD